MTSVPQSIPVDAVVFRDDLYPRIETSVSTVQKYAEDLTVLPPILVNQHYELIDGWHRWTAHRKANAAQIPVVIEVTASDAHLLERAIETNATHGLQLSQDDKRAMARRIYHVTPERERTAKKTQLAKILSVSERTVARWLDRIDKDTKADRDKRIYDMWLACHTQEEIAEAVEVSRDVVRDSFGDFGQLSKIPKSNKTRPPARRILATVRRGGLITCCTCIPNRSMWWLTHLLEGVQPLTCARNGCGAIG